MGGKKGEDRLENQDVLLTVPASFDAVARELTMEAASKAGLKQVTLLEEPQAAFYAWLAIQGEKWRQQVKVGDIILVCDVGGGTTDFTLIAVADEGGDLILSRLAVGEHILLGGDNMDLALAYAVAATLPQGMDGLDAAQRVALGYACRTAKETLFNEPKKSAAPVTVLGRGSKVIGGTVKTELTRELLNSSLLEGFLPRCAATDLPMRGRRIGLTEIGLPYAADPAISRHLARFLSQQAGSLHTGGALICPSAVLFNGGVFKAAELRRRVLDVVAGWAGKPVPELQSSDLDLAVARGAAYYGQVRRGRGVRIRGGVARSYYVGLETSRRPSQALRRRSRPYASCPWAWRKAPRPTSPAPSLAWSSASRPSSVSSAPRPAATTPWARSSTAGTPKRSRSSPPSKRPSPPKRRPGRDRTRPAPLQRERGRHPRALVPEHPRPPPLEARIQRPRTVRRLRL